MRVLVFSDPHLEFHADQGQSFVASMPKDVDAVVVAGDLASYGLLAQSVKLLCDSFPEVVLVNGNHDFYGSNPKSVSQTMKRLAQRHQNLHWLDESVAVIQGQRFVGTTLWFADDPLAFRHRAAMNDFHMIQGFVPWVTQKNTLARRFLEREVRAGDLVITHHLPSPQCTPEEYKHSPLNPFFVCDMEPLIHDRKPSLWVFGHTHNSRDFFLGGTRLIANPFGYARHEENPVFDWNCVLEV